VKSPIDPRFLNEVRRFELRFTCESCAHYDPELRTCGNGYPVEPHRERPLALLGDWVFCKEFELW
jgi:hypothetical protein